MIFIILVVKMLIINELLYHIKLFGQMNLVLNVEILLVQKVIIGMDFQKDQIRLMDNQVFIQHIKLKKLLMLLKCILIRKYKLRMMNNNFYQKNHSANENDFYNVHMYEHI